MRTGLAGRWARATWRTSVIALAVVFVLALGSVSVSLPLVGAEPAAAAQSFTVTDCLGKSVTVPGAGGKHDYAKDYHDGKLVALTDIHGKKSAFAGPKSDRNTYGMTVPLCGLRKVDNKPSVAWAYCTDHGLYDCGQDSPKKVSTNSRINAQNQQRIAYLIINGNHSSVKSRAIVQNQVWCASDGAREGIGSGEVNKPSQATFARHGITLTNKEATCPKWAQDVDPHLGKSFTLDVKGPTGPLKPREQATFTLTTNLSSDITLTATGADRGSLKLCPGAPSGTKLSGTKLTVPSARPNKSVAVKLCATRSSAGDLSLSAKGTPPLTSQLVWNWNGVRVCQHFAAFDDAAAKPISDKATVKYAAVAGPQGRTQVQGGNGPRAVGETWRDDFIGTGFAPGTYTVEFKSYDDTGKVCGEVKATGQADAQGNLKVTSPDLTVCGSGHNTATERVLDSSGKVVVDWSPKGVPSETFPVKGTLGKPQGRTQVRGGNEPRAVGETWRDDFIGTGFAPGTYTVEFKSYDDNDKVCGEVKATGQANANGDLNVTSPELTVCGSGHNTATERVLDSSGKVILDWSPKGVPQETFPVKEVGPTPSKPEGRTQVQGGNGPRAVGETWRDDFIGTGFTPGTYTVEFKSYDDTGKVCGEVKATGQVGQDGDLNVTSPELTVCGTGHNTATERVLDSSGKVVLNWSPKGVPEETFPVKEGGPTPGKPQGRTQVQGGNGPRAVGDTWKDDFIGTGFAPGIYTVEFKSYDDTGKVCGSVKATGQADDNGNLKVTSPNLTVCGTGHNTATERVLDASGKVVLDWSPKGVPSETFPVKKSSGNGSLPITGAGVLPIAIIALSAVGAGALLLVITRRRRVAEE